MGAAAAAGAKVERGGVNEEEGLDKSKRACGEGVAGMGAAGANVNEEEVRDQSKRAR